MPPSKFLILMVCWLLIAGTFPALAGDVDDARIARLINQLGDDRFRAREEASKALEAIGKPALKALREAVSRSKDPEIRHRARHLIDSMDKIDPEQLSAASAVAELGGKFELDSKSPGKPVVAVDLRGTKVTDADLVYFKKLTALRTLRLSGTRVTDAGLKHLEGLTALEYLNLGHTKVGDAGLAHLKGLTRLRTLILDNTPITDAGLKYLKGLTELRYLNL